MIFCYTDRSTPYSVVIRGVPFCNRWGHRKPHPDITQTARDLETLSPKWDLSIKPLLRAQRTLEKRRRREWKSQREWRTPRKPDPLNQHDQSSYELAEAVAACTGPAWICPGSSVRLQWFPVWCFYGTPKEANDWDPDSCVFSWTLFLLWVGLAQLLCDIFVLSYILFCCFSFLFFLNE